MLKYANFDIVFQEVPDEVTLAINISNCPNQCVGCHSKYLWEDLGEVLDKEALDQLVNQYRTGITVSDSVIVMIRPTTPCTM